MPSARRPATALLVALAIAVAACGGSEFPVVPFDPATPCTADGRQPGAYPELEALLPATFDGRAPENVDSGRSCTGDALGTLLDDGIAELRFAGATWGLGGTTGVTIAVFAAEGLEPVSMIEFYLGGAKENRKTERFEVRDQEVGDAAGIRLDVLQTDGAFQTIVAWPEGSPGRVLVLLAADLGDANVLEALDEIARG